MVGSNTFSQRLLKLWLPLTLYAIFLLFPFFWMLLVSIKPDQALLDTRLNPFAIVKPTLNHYRFLLTETDFPRWISNTLIVTVGATALSLFCSILIGYALGRFRFRCRRSSPASGSTTATGR
jgi:multiple sugar transport system permease protein